MEIILDKKQYNALLSALQAAGTVYAILGDLIDKKYKKTSGILDDLEDKILAHAEEYGAKDAMEVFEGKRCFSEKFIYKILDDLKEYDDYVFWEKLEDIMAKKELVKKYSQKEINRMGKKEFLNNLAELEDRYWNIIEKDGLKNFNFTK